MILTKVIFCGMGWKSKNLRTLEILGSFYTVYDKVRQYHIMIMWYKSVTYKLSDYANSILCAVLKRQYKIRIVRTCHLRCMTTYVKVT